MIEVTLQLRSAEGRSPFAWGLGMSPNSPESLKNRRFRGLKRANKPSMNFDCFGEALCAILALRIEKCL